jgi:Protein of unknown function (DUF1203)
MISYRITGLSPEPFADLFGLDDEALEARGVKRYVVDAKPGFPDRVEMRDLEPGERALLLNYEHQAAATPYRASHAIFVREGASARYDRVNEVPEVMRARPLSMRAFDREHMMLDADLVDGADAESLIQRFFENSDVAYIHVHYAKRGCFSARVDRA